MVMRSTNLIRSVSSCPNVPMVSLKISTEVLFWPTKSQSIQPVYLSISGYMFNRGVLLISSSSLTGTLCLAAGNLLHRRLLLPAYFSHPLPQPPTFSPSQHVLGASWILHCRDYLGLLAILSCQTIFTFLDHLSLQLDVHQSIYSFKLPSNQKYQDSHFWLFQLCCLPRNKGVRRAGMQPTPPSLAMSSSYCAQSYLYAFTLKNKKKKGILLPQIWTHSAACSQKHCISLVCTGTAQAPMV